MQKLTAGIDIGGTNTVIGLVDHNDKIVFTETLSTTSFSNPKLFVESVSSKIKSALPHGSQLEGIGIGAPNGNFFSGAIEHAPNMQWKGIVPLVELFKKQFTCEILLTNDANAAALGEMIFGAAKNMTDFLFITLGTGLGSGIVVYRQLVYGYTGMAGELGHVIIKQDGRLCGCGRKGCLETYCSATGLVITYRELTNENCSSAEIHKRALAGDEKAVEAFNITGQRLGMALANSVVYTSPEAIFLFGGLARAGNLIFDPVQQTFEKNLHNIYKNKVKILPSGLPENDAALLGAVSLIRSSQQKNK